MPRQLFRFLIAGAIGFAVDAGVLWLSLAAGQGYFVGRGLSFFAAVWTTWRINRRYTFQADGARQGSVWREWWQYLLAMSLGGAVNYAVYSLVVVSFPASRWLPFEGVALGSIAGMAVNFVSAKWWVFKRPARS
ncbi:GtrA family protein [Burkholderia alba]|uniref:GtrA family protein n=1 Tax=Burkholderia alba TaxID=2683677 RepID=UPI002B059F10|nr:GtrA family protein [Burkholderia alba]